MIDETRGARVTGADSNSTSAGSPAAEWRSVGGIIFAIDGQDRGHQGRRNIIGEKAFPVEAVRFCCADPSDPLCCDRMVVVAGAVLAAAV